MAIHFASGSVTIPAGVLEYTLTGLSISFVPDTASASLMLPDDDSEIISAYVVGAVTTDGFKVAFSSETPKAGYVLQWTAVKAGEGQSRSSGTLAVSYTDLQRTVAAFLGYDTASLTTAQTQEVDGIIQSGIRRFYYPPMMEGVEPNYEWSFLHAEGSIETESGTASYALPDGTGRILSAMVNDIEGGGRVDIVPVNLVRERMAIRSEAGRPRYAAIATDGYTRTVMLWPKPDAAYTLHFQCEMDDGKLDAETNPYPAGGVMFAELVIESCLAVAEQRSNDERGIHTQNFNELMASAIQRDRRDGAHVFGRVGDPRHHHRDFFTE